MRQVYKKKRKLKKTGFIVLFIILALLVAAGFYIGNILSKFNHKELDKDDLGITSSKEEGLTDDPNDKSITNIALFGIDYREGDKQSRSDAIIILTIDKTHNKVKLSSVMRDTLVSIEGYDKNKITTAYFYGGPQLAVKTLNQNLNLNISEYASVDFAQMANIIDAIGGVEIDVSEAERVSANNSIKEQHSASGLPLDYIKEAGLQNLSGTQAVAYARIRYVKNKEGHTDDFGRTDRQREVLEKMFYKALDMNPLQYPELARQLLPAVETSLDWSECLSYATLMLRKPTIEQMRFPQNSELIGNGSIYVGSQQCVNADLDLMSKNLHEFIYETEKDKAASSTDNVSDSSAQ